MIDFLWTLEDLLASASRGNLSYHTRSSFFAPHENVWPEDECRFEEVVEEILWHLDSSERSTFVMVCLASYLLNPAASPNCVLHWLEENFPAASSGPGMSLEELLSLRWGRAAVVLGDASQKSPGKMAYVLVGSSEEKSSVALRYPPWVSGSLGCTSLEAVETAAALARRRYADTTFFFWPIVDSRVGVSFEGTSLGLPIYLSFLSMAAGSPLPRIAATGVLDSAGNLSAVTLLEQKREVARAAGFTTFLYPLLAEVHEVPPVNGIEVVGVSTRRNAELSWRGRCISDRERRLLKSLHPFSFEYELERHLPLFTGRAALRSEIDRWASDPDGSKLLWLSGAPGIGKTAIAAWLGEHRDEYIAARHFCDFRYEERKDPAGLVSSLAYQLAEYLPEYAQRLTELPIEEYQRDYRDNGYALLDRLILRPLGDEFDSPGKSLVVLIDALDEAKHKTEDRNEMAQFVSQAVSMTPSWLRFLVTARVELDIEALFYGFPRLDLDSLAEQVDDISAYLGKRLPSLSPQQREEILRRSEGSFLYIRQLCDDLEAGRIDLDDPAGLPKGINNFYHLNFERQFKGSRQRFRSEGREFLCLVSAAREPLSVGLMQQMLGLRHEMEMHDRLDLLGPLFQRRKEFKWGEEFEVILPTHLSLIDWLLKRECSGPYWIEAGYGHALLADYGWESYRKHGEKLHPYFLAWLPSHLAACGRADDATVFLRDFNMMMARADAGLVERMLADYREILSDAIAGETAFFRKKGHILRRGDKEWPAHKILLQLAMEEADDSPLTRNAEKYLAEGRCNWPWLRRELRASSTGSDQCLAIFDGHTHVVQGALVLPDGRVLSWGWDGTLRFWDLDGTPLQAVTAHSEAIRGAVPLAAGLLTWSDDATLRMWNHNGKCLAVLEGHTGPVSGALLVDEGRIASWSQDGTVRLWDAHGKAVCCMTGHTGGVERVQLLADGRLLSWGDDATLRLWAQDGMALRVLEGHSGEIRGVVQLPGGEIVSLGRDETVHFWTGNGEACEVIRRDYGRPFVEKVLPDGHRLSCTKEKLLRVWSPEGTLVTVVSTSGFPLEGAVLLPEGRTATWKLEPRLRLLNSEGGFEKFLEGHFGFVEGALPLRHGELLSWSGEELRLWDRSGEPVAALAGHTDSIISASQLRDDRILSWSRDGTLRLWDPRAKPGTDPVKHRMSISASQTIEGGLLLTSSMDSIRLWDGEGRHLSVLEETRSARESFVGVHFFPDGRILTWANDTLTIRDGFGKAITTLNGHVGGIREVRVASDGRILSWTRGKSLRLWESSGKLLASLEGRGKFLADGRILCYGADENLWVRSSDGAVLAVMKGHEDTIDGAEGLSDGRFATYSLDRTLRLWESTGAPVAVIPVPGFFKIIPLAAGRFVSIDHGGGLRLWESSGVLVSEMQGDGNRIYEVRALHDGRIAADSSWDGVHVWSANGELLATIEGHILLNSLPDGKIVTSSPDVTAVWSAEGRLMMTLPPSCAVEALPDGGLVSLAEDSTMTRWEPHGELLASERGDAAVLFRRTALIIFGDDKFVSQTALRGLSSAAVLDTFLTAETIRLRWQGECECHPVSLSADGKAMVTEDNGQVSALQLYIGNSRSTIAELESHYAL